MIISLCNRGQTFREAGTGKASSICQIRSAQMFDRIIDMLAFSFCLARRVMFNEAEAEKTLRALESRLDAARVSGDVALFEEVLAAEFQTTNPVGAVSGREQMLADIRSGAFKVTSSRSIDIGVTFVETAAILRGKAVMKATYQGRDISGVYAYTHIYMYQDGRWRVMAAHTSRRMPDWVFFVVNSLLNLFHLKRK